MRTVLVALLLASALAAPVRADDADAVYRHACAWCHGATGRGDGPAAFSVSRYRAPRPRDFTRGRFELRSTPSGALPTDADLLRTVERGIPVHMPSFAGLTPAERRLAVIAVKRFYPGFATATPTPIPIPPVPPLDDAAVARGRALWTDAGCPSCHGDRGRGDGPSAPTLRDETGLPIDAADLRFPARFKNGAAPEDVYRTLVTGLDGTPMPSYAGALEERQLWDLVAWVRSLARR
ncbi:MAG TPA: cytochrome c [Candidatus Binatia bacterium]|nr:cytochrome c [Candidatus Binatia bacterium]